MLHTSIVESSNQNKIMAKSLRSKIKRAHRTELRKAYSQPLANKRQKKTSDELKKDLKAKQGGSLFKLANKLKGDEMDEEEESDEEEEEDQAEDNKTEAEVKPLPFSEPKGGSNFRAGGSGGRQGAKSRPGPTESFIERLKDKKRGGSKPRLASAGKNFTWFK